MFLVVRPPGALFLPPSILSKWRGLRGLEVRRARASAPRVVLAAGVVPARVARGRAAHRGVAASVLPARVGVEVRLPREHAITAEGLLPERPALLSTWKNTGSV